MSIIFQILDGAATSFFIGYQSNCSSTNHVFHLAVLSLVRLLVLVASLTQVWGAAVYWNLNHRDLDVIGGESSEGLVIDTDGLDTPLLLRVPLG